jgi:hypothetical protein
VIRININTENAAFHDWTPGHEHGETVRILRELADKLQHDGLPDTGEVYALLDENGNRVGELVNETL